MTLEEARGLAAAIWTTPNYRRRVLDVQLCEDIANLLVVELMKQEELLKKFQLNPAFEDAKVEIEKLKDILKSSEIEIEKLKNEIESLEEKAVKTDEVV